MYYQTFKGLDKLIQKNPIPITHLHVSSIHFGVIDNEPYIHLNDNSPDDEIFDNMWRQTEILAKKGVKIILMIGGAGGAYTELFSNFDKYYSLLKKTLKDRPWISGVDLDIEEKVLLDNVYLLINALDEDFGKNFIITMAPVANALETNYPGLGGFVYKDFYNSPWGKRIDYFNCQSYAEYSFDLYNAIIANNYDPSKIVFGMLDQNIQYDFPFILQCIKQIKDKYPKFGGVFIWEYFDAPPDDKDPSQWAVQINDLINRKNFLINILSKFFGY